MNLVKIKGTEIFKKKMNFSKNETTKKVKKKY